MIFVAIIMSLIVLYLVAIILKAAGCFIYGLVLFIIEVYEDYNEHTQ